MLAAMMVLALAACTRQGGLFAKRGSKPPPVNHVDWGRSVFRFETFGNERFFSDTLGLAEGLTRRGITPNALLQAGVELDGDRLPSDFRRVDVGIGPYTDPAATWRLLKANAVVGLVIRSGRIGVTCALCHSTTDERFGPGVGRRVDGVPNTRARPGAVLAWGTRSRAYLPFVNVTGRGAGPRVALTVDRAGTPEVADGLERDVDAALEAWVPGQADVVPDGIGNPTDIPPLYNLMDVGPYNYDGLFRKVADAHNYFYTVVLDPTAWPANATARARFQRASGMETDVQTLYTLVLEAIDADLVRPLVKAERAAPGRTVSGWRVNPADLDALTAYLARITPPSPDSMPDDARIAAGRRMFRVAGCNTCHLESRRTSGEIVPLHVLRQSTTSQDVDRRYDDRLTAMNAGWTKGPKGYKVPQLLGLYLTAPYLHDGSVPSLDALFSPERGPAAPHPFFISDPEGREDLITFLLAWDGREYPSDPEE